MQHSCQHFWTSCLGRNRLGWKSSVHSNRVDKWWWSACSLIHLPIRLCRNIFLTWIQIFGPSLILHTLTAATGQLASRGLVQSRCIAAMPRQERWKMSPLALTSMSAMMLLHFGAPKVLPYPETLFQGSSAVRIRFNIENKHIRLAWGWTSSTSPYIVLTRCHTNGCGVPGFFLNDI